MAGRIKIGVLIIVVFIAGVLANNIYAEVKPEKTQFTEEFLKEQASQLAPYRKPVEKVSPKNRIKESQIKVDNKKIVIEVENAKWSRFTDTNSMDPVIDKGANALQIVPETPRNIKEGDIASYQPKGSEEIIIHSLKKKKRDEEGVYFIMKGDNNKEEDPGKVRFEQIKRVVIGVIY